MATMVTGKCENCGDTMAVRAADVRRGWGRFCTKSCKAQAQTKRTGRGRRAHSELQPGEFYAGGHQWDDHK